MWWRPGRCVVPVGCGAWAGSAPEQRSASGQGVAGARAGAAWGGGAGKETE